MQVASGPVPGFLLSSSPQQLLETQRNHRRETGEDRSDGVHVNMLCGTETDHFSLPRHGVPVAVGAPWHRPWL